MDTPWDFLWFELPILNNDLPLIDTIRFNNTSTLKKKKIIRLKLFFVLKIIPS